MIFTTSSHYVNFEFKVKSSAMKMLKTKSDLYNLRCIFEIMQTINFPINGDHKRRWISEYQNLTITLPPLHIQQRIATILSKADDEVKLHKEITKKLEERNKGLSQKLLSGEIDLTSFNF